MNRLQFSGPYLRQNWSLPDSIIYYIAKNSSNPKVYQKLIQSCKYFFIKNSIIVLSCLHYTKDGWKTCAFIRKCKLQENDMCKIDLEKISYKLWIFDTFDLCRDRTLIPPSIISKIYKCQVKGCHLFRQSITLNEFLFMASSVKYCLIFECIIKDEINGLPLQLETIIFHIPKVKVLLFEDIPNAPTISSKTVKELLKLPHFSNIQQLGLRKLPESFDIDTLFDYFKHTKITTLHLNFCDSISDAFKNRLDIMIDEILETPSFAYRTPYFTYPGQNEEKRKILCERYLKRNC